MMDAETVIHHQRSDIIALSTILRTACDVLKDEGYILLVGQIEKILKERGKQ